MRRMLQMVAVAALAVVLATGAASYANGSGGGCSSLACVSQHLSNQNARLNTLTKQVNHLRARNHALNSCLGEYAVSRIDMSDIYYYGSDENNDGNFDHNNGSYNSRQGLDHTQSGNAVDQWLVRDTCTPGVYDVKR